MLDPKLQALIRAVIDSVNNDDTYLVAVEALGSYVKRMTNAEYAADGYTCPYCRYQWVTYSGEYCTDGSIVTHECSCADCGQAWIEEYRLVGYEGIEASRTS